MKTTFIALPSSRRAMLAHPKEVAGGLEQAAEKSGLK
jgi:hypothetical protein